MAGKDDDPWRRLREKEDAREAGEETGFRMRKSLKETAGAAAPADVESSKQLMEMMDQASLLIDQVNSLYNQYIAGVQKLPPLEKRKALERLVFTITQSPKATQSVQFRATSIQSNFAIHRDKWDRLLKDVESGKIKRRGPG